MIRDERSKGTVWTPFRNVNSRLYRSFQLYTRNRAIGFSPSRELKGEPLFGRLSRMSILPPCMNYLRAREVNLAVISVIILLGTWIVRGEFGPYSGTFYVSSKKRRKPSRSASSPPQTFVSRYAFPRCDFYPVLLWTTTQTCTRPSTGGVFQE